MISQRHGNPNMLLESKQGYGKIEVYYCKTDALVFPKTLPSDVSA